MWLEQSLVPYVDRPLYLPMRFGALAASQVLILTFLKRLCTYIISNVRSSEGQSIPMSCLLLGPGPSELRLTPDSAEGTGATATFILRGDLPAGQDVC